MAALESVFKNIQLQVMGHNIDEEILNHMRFTDDVTLIANNIQDTICMVHSLKTLSEKAGLRTEKTN